MKEDPTTLPDAALMHRMMKLFDLWGKFDRIYFRLLQQYNLSYNAYLVLEELLQAPEGIEPAALADKLNIPRQTMTFILDHLERDGFLARHSHPVDRRKKLIMLSAAGQQFAGQVSGDVLARECRAMESLTPEEQETLLRLYARLSSAFEDSFTRN